MRIMWLARHVACPLAIGLLAAGCVGIGSTTPPGAVTTGPSASPVPVAPLPAESHRYVNSGMTVDYGPFTIGGMHDHGTLPGFPGGSTEDVAAHMSIVVAAVTSFEPAIFNTADGSVPRAFSEDRPAPDQPFGEIVTPAAINVDQAVRGNATVGAMRVVIEGGIVGCSSFRVDVAPSVEKGRRYLLFLDQMMDAGGRVPLPWLRIRFAWPIGPDDIVQTVGGPKALVDVVAAIHEVAPEASPSPSASSSAGS
jgi:hypothetical protein